MKFSCSGNNSSGMLSTCCVLGALRNLSQVLALRRPQDGRGVGRHPLQSGWGTLCRLSMVMLTTVNICLRLPSTLSGLVSWDRVGMLPWLLVFSALGLQAWGKFSFPGPKSNQEG